MNVKNCKGCAFAQKFFDKQIDSHITTLEEHCAIYEMTKETEYICPCNSCIVKPTCTVTDCPNVKKFITFMYSFN